MSHSAVCKILFGFREEIGMEKDRALSREEAAIRLGVSPVSLYSREFRKRIGLPTLKIGRLVRFRESDVEQILAGGTHEETVSASDQGVALTVAQVQGGNCVAVQAASFGADVQLSVREPDAAQKGAWTKLWTILLTADACTATEALISPVKSNASEPPEASDRPG